MLIHRRLTCLAIAICWLSVTNQLIAAPGPSTSAPVLIFVIDRSPSIDNLKEPHTMQAMVTQALKVAGLARQPARVAVIFYNGDGVKVLAGSDGLPTAAHNTLLQQILREWPAAKDGTPIDEGLHECSKMIDKLPQGTAVRVVHFGDGQAVSGRLRPEEFPAVREAMDRQLKAIADGAYPAAIKQELAAQLKHKWQDPRTPEGRPIWKLQIEAEFEACLRHAAALKAKKVRFVSVDFAGVDQLRRIHDTAGGTDRDYVIVQPANTILDKLHPLGLTSLDGILVLPPVAFPADPTTFEKSLPINLETIGDAAVITICFLEPIRDFDQHARITVRVGSSTYTFDGANQDPDLLLSFDSAGRVAAATLTLSTIPADGQLMIQYTSPKQSHRVPAMTVYCHIRLRVDTSTTFRPQHVPADQDSPFHVDPNQPLICHAELRKRDSPNPYPVTAIEAIARRRRDGHEIRIGMKEDPLGPGSFVTANDLRLPEGTYDIEIVYVLSLGVQIRTNLPGHFVSTLSDVHITLEFDKTSKNRYFIDLAEVGDAVREGTVTMTARSANADYPLSVNLNVVDLTDSHGNTPNIELLYPTRRKITITPGRPTKILLKWSLPDRLDNIVDGLFEGLLEFVRDDTDQPLDVRPYYDADQANQPANTIRFFLRRPRIEVSCPRAFHNELITSRSSNADGELRMSIDVHTPFERSVTFKVTNPSELAREFYLDVDLPFRNQEGRSYRDVKFVLADGYEARQEILAGETGIWVYTLLVPGDVDLRSLDATVTISADGLSTRHVPIRIDVRRPLWGSRIRNSFLVLAGLSFADLAVAAVRHRRQKRLAPGSEIQITPDNPCEFLSIDRRRGGKAELCLTGRDNVYGKKGDPKLLPAPSRVAVGKVLPANGSEWLVGKKSADGNTGLTLLISRYELIDEQPVVTASVYDSGEHAEPMRRNKKRFRSRLLLASSAGLLSATFYQPAVLSTVQWLCDLFRV